MPVGLRGGARNRQRELNFGRVHRWPRVGSAQSGAAEMLMVAGGSALQSTTAASIGM